MESVCEIATTPCHDAAEAGRQLDGLRRTVQAVAAERGPGDRRGRHPPVRDVGGPADRLAPALPRPDRGPAVRRPPGADLRHPRARGRRRPRQGDPRDQRDARAPAAAARAVGQLAVLAGRRHRPALHPDADLPRLPARRHPAALRRLRGLVAADRVHGGQPGDRGLHLPLVRRAPASELRHRGDPGDGLPDPARAHARPRGAGPGDGEGARASTSSPARSSRATRTRCSTRTSGSPPATGSTASWSTCPSRDRVRTHRRSPGGSWTACAATPRTSARPTSSPAIDDLLDHGNGGARQIVVFEANHDLREVVGEIVAEPAEPSAVLSVSESAGPLRRLQELRVRGQPVRHRVPVLRPAGAQAGAEARARGRGRGPARKQRRRPRLSRLRPDEIEGIAPDTRPVATIGLIVISLLVTLVLATEEVAI